MAVKVGNLQRRPTLSGTLQAMKIEYFFDFSCPYAYLGSTQIEALAARHDAELVWKPMLLGGVFRAVHTPMNLASGLLPAKARHNAQDMMRWAKALNVLLRMPKAHPISTLRAQRALLASPHAFWPKLIHGFYRAYWELGIDISESRAVADILKSAGMSVESQTLALAANESEHYKQELRQRTDEAIERGVFGAPTTFLSGGHLAEAHMFYGQDRFELCEEVLQGWNPQSARTPQAPLPSPPARPAEAKAHIDFWYDFASPFAYLGATQVEALAKRVGATLRWRPLLLGALFKSIGTDNVPLLTMSEAKRKYLLSDLHHWAAYTGQPFHFAKVFPLRTVTALRLALLAKERVAELSLLLFRAAWAEGKDIGDPALLEPLLRAAGFDALAMLADCGKDEVKAQLRQNTAEAEALGVFGVPTSIITHAGESQLYWGQDRFALAEQRTR
jgi:2-hydroxychromene-2-carboxylate isomerase